MKTPIICCVLFILLAQSLNSQWTIYQTNTTMQLNKIQFINENTGFAAGGGPFSDSAVFFRTTNAGLNWINYKILDSTAIPLDEVYGLYFVNENTGFVCGRYMYIYKTTNGGVNWKGYKPPYYSLTQIYNALYFIDENTGYVAGRYGYFCKTTNSGLNWELTSAVGPDLSSVWFVDSSTGYIGGVNGTVYKTTDGGNNFSEIFLGAYSIESIKFSSVNTGFASGYNAYYYSAIYKTTNAGLIWSKVYQGNYEIYDIFLFDNNSGYASCLNHFLKTTNSGQSWNIYNASFQGWSLYFLNQSTGYVSASAGKIFKTTSGGVGINQISSEVPEGFKISNCYPNPFNTELKVQFELDNRLIKNSNIILEVYNALGKKILFKNINLRFSGIYEIGIRFDEDPSGIYFVRLRSEDIITNSKKIILLK